MHKLFRTKVSMWQELKKGAEGLDYNSTLRVPLFTFIMEDGTCHRCGNVKNFAETINKVFGFNINPNLSRRAGKAVTLWFDEDIVKTDIVPEEPKELTETDMKVLAEEDTTELEQSVNDAVEIVVEDKDEIFIDWVRLEALGNNKEDKKFLDSFAESNFNIKLNRTMKISNMLSDFKEKLADK